MYIYTYDICTFGRGDGTIGKGRRHSCSSRVKGFPGRAIRELPSNYCYNIYIYIYTHICMIIMIMILNSNIIIISIICFSLIIMLIITITITILTRGLALARGNVARQCWLFSHQRVVVADLCMYLYYICIYRYTNLSIYLSIDIYI